MKILTAGVVSALLAAGTAGSVAAYRSQAGVDVATRAAAQETPSQPATTGDVQARPRVRWAPCPAGSVLERGTCVTDVVRTVVLPSTPRPAPAAPSGEVRGSDDDDQADEHADDQTDDHAEDEHGDDGDHADHGDDDHAEDHGDDDGDDHGEAEDEDEDD